MKRAWTLVGLSLAVAGCQWVPLTPEGKAVRILSEADVASCQLVATVTGKTTVTVGPLARNEAKVANEVEALARNEAAKSGANAIVPKGPLEWDERTYAAYRCEGW
jgi:hypothetical protein